MLIQQTIYPEFVADQILSSEHLNRLFGYLEEQERLTRANLIGIGIVCGLEVKVNAAGTALTITKGSGITSKGYLVSIPETTYYGYKAYDVRRNHVYDLFTPVPEDTTSDIPVDDLVTNPAADGVTPLTTAYLKDNVVLMFVELRAQTIEDCDTNDCDDDGVMVSVNLRPMLVNRSFVDALFPLGGNVGTDLANLPEIALRRFDVTATALDGSGAIIDGYRKIIADQVQLLDDALAKVYISMYPFVFDEYPTNPFQSLLADRFSFIADGSYPVNDMLHIQYYYDLLADIYNAYDLIRDNADHLVSACNADGNLFPRHLFLGPASNMSADGSRVEFRNYFMPSGAMQSCCGQVGELRLEFKRLVLLLETFTLPTQYQDTVGINEKKAPSVVPIRLTPDRIGNVSLSQKSIPFYYDANAATSTDKLYRYWDYVKTHAGHADRNLSYNADKYRTGPADDPILQPLYYDLEDYNFIRVEGHITLAYREAVNTILTLRNQYRLPFGVIALRTSHPAASALKKLCCGDGLELSYDIVSREWEAVIGETIAYIDANRTLVESFLDTEGGEGSVPEPSVAETANYRAKLVKAKTYMVTDMSAFMQKHDEFMGVYETIESESTRLRDIVYNQLGNQGMDSIFGEDLVDHLDAVIQSCKKGAFRALIQAWQGIGLSLEDTLTLSEYVKVNPGITHRAGVPMNGTLVLLYHTAGAESGDSPVDTMLANVAEGTVIADFYLPYQCCSDCSPIEVSIGDGKPPVVKPTISLEDNITKICMGTAKEKYAINITPDDATVTADITGAVTYDSSIQKWYLLPSVLTFADADISKTVTLTCDKDGQTASLVITIYAQPVLSFNFTQNGNTVFITNTSKHTPANSVTWSFGDGFTSTDYNPSPYTYATADKQNIYSITLSGKGNGTCTTVQPARKDVTVAASLPCGGRKSTCNLLWPYTKSQTQSPPVMLAKSAEQLAVVQDKNIVINLAIIDYIVGTTIIASNLPTIQLTVTSDDISVVWPAIANYLNNRFVSAPLALRFGTTYGSYNQIGGYPVPVTAYACLDFRFKFRYNVVVNGVSGATYNYMLTRNGTYINTSGGDRLVYQDPNCIDKAQQQSPPLER